MAWMEKGLGAQAGTGECLYPAESAGEERGRGDGKNQKVAWPGIPVAVLLTMGRSPDFRYCKWERFLEFEDANGKVHK